MKITVEFNSLDEISEFQKLYVVGNNIIEDFIKEEVKKQLPTSEKEPKAAQEEASEPKKGKKAGTKQPETVEKEPENGTDEPESGTEAEETGTAPEVDTEKLKVEVRKLLTKVNKQTGKNQAKEWITNLGHDSLTDVEDADDLLALKGLAEEVLNA